MSNLYNFLSLCQKKLKIIRSGEAQPKKIIILWLKNGWDKNDRYVNIYGKKGFDLLTTNKKAIAENTLDDKEKENHGD